MCSVQKLEGYGTIYNNCKFGRISWSKDGTKIVFIAERSEIKEYTSYWRCKSKEVSEAIPFTSDNNFGSGFGEGMGNLKHPIIVIYDLEMKLCKTIDISELEQNKKLDLKFKDVFPAFPLFDEQGTGIIFQGYYLPVDKAFNSDLKLGLLYCLNRPTKLYYIKQYEINYFESKDKIEIEILTENYYFSGFPKFSSDYKYLSFICSPESFHTHITCFELRVIKNLGTLESNEYCVIKKENKPNNIFSGLYIYEPEYFDAQFIKGTDIILVPSFNKGCSIMCAINVSTCEITVLQNKNSSTNNCIELFNISEELTFLHSSSNNEPQTVYMAFDIDKDSKWIKIDKIESVLRLTSESEFIEKVMKCVKVDSIKSSVGAEAFFIRPYDINEECKLFELSRRPLIVYLHGGPHDTYISYSTLSSHPERPTLAQIREGD